PSAPAHLTIPARRPPHRLGRSPNMWRTSCMVLAVCAAVFGQDSGLPPDLLLLARIRVHMAENLKRQPNYTCLETIERTRRPLGGRAQVVDILRMEVALVDGKEMFAWPGSKKFEDVDLREMVSSGTFGNGNYALFARNVFLSGSPTFERRPDTEVRG